jgi:hypothetical protein
MKQQYVAGLNPLRNPTDVVDWTTGTTVAAGFSTREDAQAAAKLACMAYQEGYRAAQADVRRALGMSDD